MSTQIITGLYRIKARIDSAISDHGLHFSINLCRKLAEILGE